MCVCITHIKGHSAENEIAKNINEIPQISVLITINTVIHTQFVLTHTHSHARDKAFSKQLYACVCPFKHEINCAECVKFFLVYKYE